MSKQQLAIVTGGSRGIGAAIAEEMSSAGWVVGRIDIEFPDGTDDSLCEVADVREPESLRAAVTGIVERSGESLGAFVNNAGIARRGKLVDLSQDDWQDVIDVNLTGVFNGLRACRPHLGDGGAVVNIASIAAERGAAGRSPYGAAKAGVVALTKAAAVEWAEDGIRVNAVSPGYAATELVREAIAEGSLPLEGILPRIPMDRMAETREIGQAVAFLCSEGSRYITGQALAVDGGFLADYGVPLNE